MLFLVTSGSGEFDALPTDWTQWIALRIDSQNRTGGNYGGGRHNLDWANGA